MPNYRCIKCGVKNRIISQPCSSCGTHSVELVPTEKPPVNAQPHDVFRSTTMAVGSCLTCDRENKYVYVIRHNGSEVRLCATCITIIDMKVRGY